MVLVSVLGDFHSSILPVFYNFKEKLTHHIILHDDSRYDKTHASKIIDAQKDFITLYKNDTNINYKLINISIDEDSYDDILLAYEKIIKQRKNPQDIYLNSTDGLSSIGIILSNKFLQYGSKVISYDRFANTYNEHTNNSMKKKNIKYNMDIKNHLRLKGYELKSYSNKFELKRRKPYILEITKDMKEFKKFTNKYIDIDADIDSSYKNYRDILIKMDQYEKPFVQGGIFEELIYWTIKDNIKLDDIMVGVHIEFDKDIYNEIDILMIKDNHLHTIELKFTSKFKTNVYLYKTDSVMDYIDDDGKGMIYTISGKSIGWQDEARATNDNIKFLSHKNFDKKLFIDEVCEFFGLEAK